MERLTQWNGQKYVLPQGRTSDGQSSWRLVADRLAAYENTGLAPDEIRIVGILPIVRLVRALEQEDRTEDSKARVIAMYKGLGVISGADADDLAGEYCPGGAYDSIRG